MPCVSSVMFSHGSLVADALGTCQFCVRHAARTIQSLTYHIYFVKAKEI